MTQYYKRPRAAPFEIEEMRVNVSQTSRLADPLTCNISYLNGLSDAVTIVQRSGLAFTVPAATDRNERDFVIRLNHSFSKGVNIDGHYLLNGVNENSPIELQKLQEALNRRNLYARGREEFSLDYLVSRETLQKRGGSVYLVELDIVVSILSPNHVPLHPFSDVGMRAQLLESDPAVNSPKFFGMNIRIVDNNGRFGDRFVNMSGQIYKVVALKSSTLRDGVYMTSSAAVDGDYDVCPPTCTRYSFEEADAELKLFRTVDEARTLGDIAAATERELKELQGKLRREEHEFKLERLRREDELDVARRTYERNKLEFETDMSQRLAKLKLRELELDEQKAELDAMRRREDHLRTMEAMARKDLYEARSQNRKDVSEYIKYVPVVIAGVASILLAIKKLTDDD